MIFSRSIVSKTDKGSSPSMAINRAISCSALARSVFLTGMVEYWQMTSSLDIVNESNLQLSLDKWNRRRGYSSETYLIYNKHWV